MNGNCQIKAPVLLIAFNRPDTTLQVFEKIRQVKPAKLFIAVDGPRKDNQKDEDLVSRVREIVRQVDWPCDARYRFNESNLGAEITVSSAIGWVFQTEEYVIILEDDIVAPPAFFIFVEEMLRKYADCPEIGTVSGSNFTPLPVPGEADYFFAKYGHSWGWGTWKRAWDGFDLNVVIPDKHLTDSFLKKITNSRKEKVFYKKNFRKMKENGAGRSTWDNVARYYHRINGRLSIIPRVNLTTNIGVSGLHANGQTEHHFRPYDENFTLIKHPDRVEYFKEYDVHHFSTYIHNKQNLFKRLVKKITK